MTKRLYPLLLLVLFSLLVARNRIVEIKRIIYIERAQQHALASRYADAVADLTAALELDPSASELFVLRGQMYLYLYQWDAVLADYNSALELDPGYADAYFYRGVLYASILQTGIDLRDEALADFQHYLDLAPDGDHAVEAAAYIDSLQSAQDAID